MTVDEIASKVRDKLAGSSFDKSVKIDFKGEGVVLIDGQDVSTTDAPADCTITISKSDFADLVSGDLSPTGAFMTGKMKVAGDMSAAMSLSQVL